jgi:hypothetical protein
MPGLGDLLGADGAIRQLFLWSVVNQVITNLSAPAFTALLQDMQAEHPEIALDAATVADLLARHLVSDSAARAEAAKTGINGERFARLADLRKVRVSPPDLAEATLRSYLSQADADAQGKPQGYTPEMMRLLRDLAGDAPGPQQLAEALRRGLIPAGGRGPAATSFAQGIAESRLHDKWADMLADLSTVIPSGPELAEAVVRHFKSHPDAVTEAAKAGVPRQLLDLLILLAGDAPGPQQLAEALRRGLIPATGTGPDQVSFEQGIAEGRLAGKWGPVIQGLAQLWPTPTDALHAEVEGQLTTDEATAMYERLGGNPDFRQWLFNTIGEGPTPLEAARLAARGIIPWQGTGPKATSYEQAVRESRYRDKWTGPYRALAEHIPPPSTIATMLAHQQLTEAEARQLLLQNDMTPDLAAAYIGEAEFEAISDWRGLTVSSVIDMYVARLIDAGQATQVLAALHVTPQAARLLLGYADLRYYIDSINRGVQRIAQLFTGRKITAATARAALLKYNIPPGTVELVIGTWTIQAAASVKTLTAAEIEAAWAKQVIDQPTALADLEAIGYTPFDAWVKLSTKAGGPLPNPPPRDVVTPPPPAIPGTT